MFETLNPSIKTATIVGGGMAGLLTAYSFVKKGYIVNLYEKSSRLGGLIETHQTPYGMAESAANTLPATPETIALLRDIGVHAFQAAPDMGKGMIWRDGQMKKFPLKIWEAAIALFKAAWVISDGKEKSFADWTRAHAGQAALDYLVDPVAHGIYGTSPEMLDIPAAFKSLFIPEGKTLLMHLWPQRKRKKRMLLTPKEGMQEIVERLHDYLYKSGRARIHLNTTLRGHPEDPNTIFCVPAYELGDYMPHLKEAADKIVYSSMVTATAFVKKDTMPPLPRTFGLLIPRKEKSNILGIIFNSVVFPNRVYNKDYECITLMMKTMRDDDDAIKESVAIGLQRFLGCAQAPAFISITRWNKAIPVYNATLREFWEKANAELPPGTSIFGNYTGEVSLRGMIEATLKN